MKKILAHGTFDILHYGHVHYLEKAKSYGDYLIVYITSDNLAKKSGKTPYFNEKIRAKMINALKVVDEVIIRDSYITEEMVDSLHIDIFVTTNSGFNYDYLKNVCEIKLIERTKDISSTKIKKAIASK